MLLFFSETNELYLKCGRRNAKHEKKKNTQGINFGTVEQWNILRKMKNIIEKVFSEFLVFLLTLSVIEATTSSSGNQKFLTEPESISAVIGSRVLLPCKVEHKQGVLQWTKDDFGLGTHRNLSAFDRYVMIGTDEDGNYTLQIDPLQIDDDGKYQCQVSPGPQGESFRPVSNVENSYSNFVCVIENYYHI